MSDAAATPWERFTSDPRSEAGAGLRSSEMDRSVALDALATAYADGRLDREEYDERSETVQGSKTLGELVPPLRDLAPDRGSGALTVSSSSQLQEQAEAHYRRSRQGALGSFLVPSLICWVVWLVIAGNEGFQFPWPVFVMFSGIPLLQLLINKQAVIDSEKRKIQRRELRRIEERPR